MSVNKWLPHVLVLPEDDANRQLANGFLLDPLLATRRMQILEEAGGWQEVLNRFREEHVPAMDRYPERFMVLLIDFDRQNNRLAEARAVIPEHMQERVFVLGVWTEPEELRQARREPYEEIGLALARDCRDNTSDAWSHELLAHNAGELEGLRNFVRPFLFQ